MMRGRTIRKVLQGGDELSPGTRLAANARIVLPETPVPITLGHDWTQLPIGHAALKQSAETGAVWADAEFQINAVPAAYLPDHFQLAPSGVILEQTATEIQAIELYGLGLILA